jgi:hypothetical protein
MPAVGQINRGMSTATRTNPLEQMYWDTLGNKYATGDAGQTFQRYGDMSNLGGSWSETGFEAGSYDPSMSYDDLTMLKSYVKDWLDSGGQMEGQAGPELAGVNWVNNLSNQAYSNVSNLTEGLHINPSVWEGVAKLGSAATLATAGYVGAGATGLAGAGAGAAGGAGGAISTAGAAEAGAAAGGAGSGWLTGGTGAALAGAGVAGAGGTAGAIDTTGAAAAGQAAGAQTTAGLSGGTAAASSLLGKYGVPAALFAANLGSQFLGAKSAENAMTGAVENNREWWQQNAFPNAALMGAKGSEAYSNLSSALLQARRKMMEDAARRGLRGGSLAGGLASIDRSAMRDYGKLANDLIQFENTPQFSPQGTSMTATPTAMQGVSNTVSGLTGTMGGLYMYKNYKDLFS